MAMSSKQKGTKRGKVRAEEVDQLVHDVAARCPGVFSDHLAQETYEALAKQLVSSSSAWSNSAPDNEAVAAELKGIGERVALKELGREDIDELIETMARESASRVADQVENRRSPGIREFAEELWSKLKGFEAGTALSYADAPQMQPTPQPLPGTIAACSRGPTMVGVFTDTPAAIRAAQGFRTQARRRPELVCAIAETETPIRDWINFERLVHRAAFLGHENYGTGILITGSAPEALRHLQPRDEGARELGGLGRERVFAVPYD